MTANQTRSKFIDFQALKQEIKIEEAMPLLGLQVLKFSDQMRLPCPACKSGGDRALVITASKNVFYCFAAGEGGDVISLTAHIKGINMKEAAAFLADHLVQVPAPPPSPEPVATVPSYSSSKKEKAGLNPLTYLQPEHPLVQALGISPETCRHFCAGYAPKGIMRGRLAIPIHDVDGKLIAYCGYVLTEHERVMRFPKDFAPGEYLFNASRVHEGVLTLLKEPLAVLLAFEAGLHNTCALFANKMSLSQLRTLTHLVETNDCEFVDFY